MGLEHSPGDLLRRYRADREQQERNEELEIRQNELYLAMGVVESMPASEAQTACISELSRRMQKLVALRGKSEVGRGLADG